MAATVDDKSDVVQQPNQFEDDQKNELLPAEKKESDLNAPDEKKKQGDFDDSNLPEKTRHPLGTSCKLFPLHAWLYFLYIVLVILLPIFLWQMEQHWLLLPLCHPRLPLAQAQAGGPQLHRHLPRAAAGEFGHKVDIISKRQDHPQLAC